MATHELTCALQLSEDIFTFVSHACAALLFVDRWGRRPLLMLGSAGCAAGLAAATVAAAMGSVEGLVATLSVFILSMR